MPSKTTKLRPNQKAALRPAEGAHQPAPARAHAKPATNADAPASRDTFDNPYSQLLFSNNPQPMYIYEPKTLAFLDVNEAALAQYGYTREEFLGMRLTDIRPVEDVPRILEAVRKNPTALVFRGCWRHKRKNGQVFEVEVTTQGIVFAGRKTTLACVQDISARRAAEKEVAEHNAYLHALTENNPLAIVVLDANHRVQMCNPAFETLFGYHQSEILGAELDLLVAPARDASEALELSRRSTAGEVVRAETKRRRSDGSLVDVQIVGVPLTANGKRIGSFGMYEDITERRRAEEAQLRAEERLRLLFENAVEGIFQTTPQGRILSMNPALARMCGYSSCAEMLESIVDVARDAYADPEFREEFKRRIEKKGVVEKFEYQLRRKDGAKIWVSENARAVRDAQGKIVCYEGTVEDITEHKRAELERQVSFEIIRGVNLTDNLDDLLGLIHLALKKVLYAENCFVALYEPASEMFHFPFFVDQFDVAPPPQQVGRSCTAYVYRTGRAMLIPQKAFDKLAEQGEVELVGTPSPSWLGVPLRTPAATIGVLVVQHYGSESAYTERDLEFLGSVGGQIALAIERKRAEEKVRESEARLRVLVEQLPAVLWTVGKDLRFTSAMGAGLTRLGLKQNEVVGMSLLEYFETSDQSFKPIAAHRRAMAGDPTTFHVEWKGGSYACHVEPLRDANGQLQGAICMALDITDRRQLEEQLRQSQKMEAVGRLAGGIAHDFNNLLMVIQGYADLLADRLAPGDPLRRNAEQIQTASQRATSLTRQLLAFSRKQMLAPKIISIQSIFADMEKILRRLIGEDIQLETSSAPDAGLIKADRSQIEQVILNLAVNARDAMPQGGRLTIETANVDLDASYSRSPAVLAPGKYVMLAVTDNGCGMDAETQTHIFEPFFTTKEKGKGTGLGLATVYGIVKQSGGYVWVYSEPGRGTSFKIYLPRIEDEEGDRGRDRRSDAGAVERGSETILLVEDEKGVRELAREYLEMSGYTVIEAEDGHTALELAAMHAGTIHLLMTDVVMPGISGRELAERVRVIRPKISVLYMSGYTDQAVVHHGILETDAVLLQKPFTMTTLSAKLREILTAEAVQ
ncbi:MAG TPA: PAS domain S-box protein [Candidatus Acidoferrales bacterium]|nr:PAS domain S-box protein [Candidatus Acidoferrales bacterium]